METFVDCYPYNSILQLDGCEYDMLEILDRKFVCWTKMIIFVSKKTAFDRPFRRKHYLAEIFSIIWSIKCSQGTKQYI